MNNRFLVLLLISLTTLSFYIFSSLVFYIFVALLLSIATADINKIIVKKIHKTNYSFLIKNKYIFSSTILTLSLFLFVFLPLCYLLIMTINFIPSIEKDMIVSYLNQFSTLINNVPDYYQEEIKKIFQEIDKSKISVFIMNSIKNIYLILQNGLFSFFLILFFYLLINIYWRNIYQYFNLIPLTKPDKKILLTSVNSTISIVLYGAILLIYKKNKQSFIN